MDKDNDEPKSGNECPGDCGICPYKTFDSQESYEFICDKYGWVVW